MPRKQSREEREAEFEEAEPVDCIAGPVEDIDGTLALRIPLDSGGRQLVECARGAGHIDDGCLVILLPPPAVEALGLTVGSRVVVGRKGSRFSLWTEERWSGTDETN